MGNIDETCSKEIDQLEIPVKFNQQFEHNLIKFKEHLPKKSYARKSERVPKLSPLVEKILQQLNQAASDSNSHDAYNFLKKRSKSDFNSLRNSRSKESENESNSSSHNPSSDVKKAVRFPPFYILKKRVHYKGHWYEGLPHGNGSVYFPNGSYFRGNFNSGEAEGMGLFIYSDGSYYDGNFKNSIKNGFGVFCSSNGTVFKGTWKADLPDGPQCTEVYPDGNKYIGKFSEGFKNGYGQFFWADGKVYSGNFKDGCMHGEGTLKKGKDSYFRGLFYKNKKQGHGVLDLPYGKYEGSFIDGLMGGIGIFTWKDGRVYEGNFLNGKLHGKGILQFPNGRVLVGQWQDGQNCKIEKVYNEKLKP